MNARAEAEGLAGFLPGILLEARHLAAAAPGLHGRRRAGPGEAFWQFRDHRPEDGARLVDWRRSARGERLYVREREKEAAQTASFWIDPDPGFAFSSNKARPSKYRRALVLCLAMGALLARGGERVAALGQGATRSGPRAIERLALDLSVKQSAAPANAPARSTLILASDFYAPVEQWRTHLTKAAQSGVSGALLMIADPMEEDFPYEGRTEFEEPGGARRRVVFGKAQSAQEEYQRRLQAHRAEMRAMAQSLGFLPILHRTDKAPAPALSLLTAALEERR
jgi:uncharacterized protein (DUF58 family)